MNRVRVLLGALIASSFVCVAVAQSWPLPRYLSTRLTGNPGGDTGVYVWNVWLFRHELQQGKTPLTTDRILALADPVDLSLHNYTVSSDVMALPLLSFLDVVSAFNVVYLANVALVGLGGYVLARRLRPRDPVSRGVAWLAGLALACSPFIGARSTAHFSLVAAAALPFFVVALDRAWHSGRLRDAALVGATVAWAAYSDPYYAIYAVLLGLAFVTSHVADVSFGLRPPGRHRLTPVIDILLGAALIVVCVVAIVPRQTLRLGSTTVSMSSLYTPVLVLTMLVVVRVCLAMTVRNLRMVTLPARWMALAATALGTAMLLLAPLLVILAQRAVDGEWMSAPVLWRSSAPGVDLVSFLVPNPMHALAPDRLVQWLASEPGRFEENVVAIPWVVLATIVAARLATGRWGSRLWSVVATCAVLVTLGPFIRVAGIETYIPTPWAVIRYVPLIGEARVPARFGVVVILAAVVLFAEALDALGRSYPARRGLIVAVTGTLLVAELWPIPRTLYGAELPSVYGPIVADRRDVSVLQLPFGVRDGLSSLGDFTALSQFYQTWHGKQLVGGYLSRVSDRRKEELLHNPFIAALIDQSERRRLTDEARAAARADARDFVDSVRLGYVVIDESRTTPALRQLAIETLRLKEVQREAPLVLYVPGLND